MRLSKIQQNKNQAADKKEYNYIYIKIYFALKPSIEMRHRKSWLNIHARFLINLQTTVNNHNRWGSLFWATGLCIDVKFIKSFWRFPAVLTFWVSRTLHKDPIDTFTKHARKGRQMKVRNFIPLIGKSRRKCQVRFDVHNVLLYEEH